MSFDFSTLVTDRTQADVSRVKQIAEKIKNGTASESELAEFNSAAMKGAYNYTDLNRVTAAMEALKTKLEGYGYAVPGYQRIKVPHNPPPVPGASRLPEGYLELTYIESTGAQYIDTGFKPSWNSRVVVDVSNIPTGNAMIFGCRNASSGTAAQQFNIYRSGSTAMRSDYFGTNASLSISDTTGRTVIDKNGNVVTMYGNIVTNTAVSSGTVAYNMFLFAVNNVGTANSYASYKLYSCQIYDNGVLVRDFVPCINPAGAVGLYDLVTEAFFGNAGTGVFVAGETVEAAIAAVANAVDETEYDQYTWYEFDWPTPETMTIYLLNVVALRSVFAVMASTPSVPPDRVSLMAEEANNIEKILVDMNELLMKSTQAWFYSGELFAGEV